MFVAPEVFDGEAASEKSDVYAYGVLLLCLWAHTDELYPNINDMEELMEFVYSGKRPEIPSKVMPPLIESLIRVCWHQSPEKR